MEIEYKFQLIFLFYYKISVDLRFFLRKGAFTSILVLCPWVCIRYFILVRSANTILKAKISIQIDSTSHFICNINIHICPLRWELTCFLISFFYIVGSINIYLGYHIIFILHQEVLRLRILPHVSLMDKFKNRIKCHHTSHVLS